MPRQIIDVESGRPAYARRRVRRLVLWLVLAAVLAAALWFLARRVWGQETRAAAGTASQCLFEQKRVSCAR